jgi:hypothetical protein
MGASHSGDGGKDFSLKEQPVSADRFTETDHSHPDFHHFTFPAFRVSADGLVGTASPPHITT